MTTLDKDVQRILATHCKTTLSSTEKWRAVQAYLLKQDNRNFNLHLALYHAIYPERDSKPAPASFCSKDTASHAHLNRWMKQHQFTTYQELHTWSHQQYQTFWHELINDLQIKFDTPYTSIADISQGIENIEWLPGATLNIANSCFNADKNAVAIMQQTSDGDIVQMTYQQLDLYSNRIANTLVARGFKTGDAIAIDMTMNADAIAIYLGIIKAGMVVVSIADSFAANEVYSRLSIAKTKAIFVHDVIIRNKKQLPLYEKIVDQQLPPAIVVPMQQQLATSLRDQDVCLTSVLSDNDAFISVSRKPHDHSNILFSSGTTGTPKAIPWSHTTPIRCASDAMFHQDIHPHYVLCWPTNLGWMMGPWLIYAALMNQATIALYDNAPNDERFGRFIEHAGVTMLGLVPSMVKAWRTSHCMETCDWSKIKTFSSSGECSNPDDMFYLMFLAGYKPIIEYCGGTEIGGAYISSTVIQDNCPSLFTTATMGLDFVIVDDQGQASHEGAVMIVPPAIGLSTELLNRDHHQEYFSHDIKLDRVTRKHGDNIQRIDAEHFRLQGRNDDTMNLGGIKTSAVEIERVLNNLPDVIETAAIAVTEKNGGAQQLIIFAHLQQTPTQDIKPLFQQAIRQHLNPLFKIQELIICDALPKTASNKIMRKDLRAQYKRRA